VILAKEHPPKNRPDDTVVMELSRQSCTEDAEFVVETKLRSYIGGWLHERLADFVAFWIVLMTFFGSILKIKKLFYKNLQNMTNVYTFKMKVTTKGKA